MTSETLVEASVDPAVEARARSVLREAGLTLSEAFGLFLIRAAETGGLPFEPPNPDHDSWFRSKVEEALNDPRPGRDHDAVSREFAARRAATLSRL